MNDPTNWNPQGEFDALTFASYTDAKKAEVLFNRFMREQEQLAAILRRASVALDDWLNTYADELCDEKRVKEAAQRIYDGGGTLAYIADIQQEIRRLIEGS